MFEGFPQHTHFPAGPTDLTGFPLGSSVSESESVLHNVQTWTASEVHAIASEQPQMTVLQTLHLCGQCLNGLEALDRHQLCVHRLRSDHLKNVG